MTLLAGTLLGRRSEVKLSGRVPRPSSLLPGECSVLSAPLYPFKLMVLRISRGLAL
jgi:hypothetical protein